MTRNPSRLNTPSLISLVRVSTSNTDPQSQSVDIQWTSYRFPIPDVSLTRCTIWNDTRKQMNRRKGWSDITLILLSFMEYYSRSWKGHRSCQRRCPIQWGIFYHPIFWLIILRTVFAFIHVLRVHVSPSSDFRKGPPMQPLVEVVNFHKEPPNR